jgi:hypothetical protein
VIVTNPDFEILSDLRDFRPPPRLGTGVRLHAVSLTVSVCATLAAERLDGYYLYSVFWSVR